MDINKVVIVRASFKEDEKNQKIVDMENFAKGVSNAVISLNSENYEVVDITPITSGYSNAGLNNAFAYDYSYTEGVIILAKKINNAN